MGYDHSPEVSRAALHDAAVALTKTGLYSATTWEDLRVGGQSIISTILTSIENSELCLFDLTTLNPNVLFELGFAIAKRRRVGILMDQSSDGFDRRYKRFGLLRGVGYHAWSDVASITSHVLYGAYSNDDAVLGDTLLTSAEEYSESSLLFIPAEHQTEPDSQIRGRVNLASEQGVAVISSDPDETSLESLTWYASKAYSCRAALFHFEAPRHSGHELHNARLALIAGMAHGFGRSILMIAESGYEVPLDYQDLLRKYDNASEASALVTAWLEGLSIQVPERRPSPRLELAVELRSLSFGEHVAENEIAQLPSYFVETAQFREVLASHLSIFVGRKGTGKTANLYLAASRLRSDPENLVVVVRPASNDFEGLVVLLDSFSKYIRNHTIDGIWKLLLLTEIARKLVDDLESRADHIPLSKDERALVDGVESAPYDIRGDFGSRVDRAIRSLSELDVSNVPPEEGRELLNEALHSEWIGRLRRLLAPVIGRRRRVAILIDNLDKGWERTADLDAMTNLLLGLLSAVGKVESDVLHELKTGTELTITLAVFLRSDIFAYVKSKAREPDKIVASIVEWADPDVLMRVVEERYLSTRADDPDPSEMWNRFFCDDVNGVATRDYLLSRVLPRPRDLIYLCNAAVGVAINRRHAVVEPEDIITAEESYSQFAFEALLVENGITVEEFESVLLEFLGSDPILEKVQILELIRDAGFDALKSEQILGRLKAVSFLGIEVSPGDFQFPEVGRAAEKAEILARKRSRTEAGTRHCVHPAYRRFLEIQDPPSPLGS